MYVSLYGLTSVRQIEDEFQRQLHPILSSKQMKIEWAVAKGLSIEPEVDISVGVSASQKRDRDRQYAGISTRFRLRDRNGTVLQTMLTSATIAYIPSCDRIPEGGEGTTIRGQFLEHNAVALIEHLKNVAARSWASRARLTCRMAAPIAPTIGADMYSHASRNCQFRSLTVRRCR
jgi:hypothetical protein